MLLMSVPFNGSWQLKAAVELNSFNYANQPFIVFQNRNSVCQKIRLSCLSHVSILRDLNLQESTFYSSRIKIFSEFICPLSNQVAIFQIRSTTENDSDSTVGTRLKLAFTPKTEDGLLAELILWFFGSGWIYLSISCWRKIRRPQGSAPVFLTYLCTDWSFHRFRSFWCFHQYCRSIPGKGK